MAIAHKQDVSLWNVFAKLHNSVCTLYLIFSEAVCVKLIFLYLAIFSALGTAASQHVEFGVVPFCVAWNHAPGSLLESFGHNEFGGSCQWDPIRGSIG